MPAKDLEAPFPYFGGKRRAAHLVWDAFGDPGGYLEPFAGSAATLLGRPGWRDTGWRRVETLNDADGWLCLAPESQILCEDFRWRPIGDLHEGDVLIGFDEGNGSQFGFQAPSNYRRFAKSRVVSTRRITKPSYRLTFSDGTTVVASEDHMWLSGSHRPATKGGRGWKWLKTSSLVCNRKTQSSWVMKICDVVHQEDSYEAGWAAGFYDGEGNVRGLSGSRVNITQKLGPESDRIEAFLKDRGFDYFRVDRERPSPRQPLMTLEIRGGLQETWRFLMMVRPERLISNTLRGLEKTSIYGKKHSAVSLVEKEYLGEVEVVALETDTHTYIAEGLASHNCNLWRSIKFAPDEVAKHADEPMFEIDLHAKLVWLHELRNDDLIAWLEGNPEHYDAKAAGWWLTVMAGGIGDPFAPGPWHTVDGKMVRSEKDENGKTVDGISRRLPYLGCAGRGVYRDLSHYHEHQDFDVVTYLRVLASRLKRVRIACGDWKRVLTPAAANATAGGDGRVAIFFDPPYITSGDLYQAGDSGISPQVREWCAAAPKAYRIALAGFDDEHDALLDLGWTKIQGKSGSGSGYNKDQFAGRRERLWLSPNCQAHIQDSLLDF